MKKITLADKAEIVGVNADAALSEASRAARLIKGQVYELALSAAEDDLQPRDAVKLYHDVFGSEVDGIWFAHYCAYFADAVKKKGKVIRSCDVFTDSAFSDASASLRGGRISYVMNPHSDKAFRRFRVVLGATERIDAQSFESACEDAEGDTADGCILPVCNDRDGVMTSFVRLAFRHGLKTVAQCAVPMSDGETETLFSMLSSSLPSDSGDADLISVFFRPDSVDLSALIGGAAYLGAVPKRIDTLPLGYDENDLVTNVIFKFDSEGSGGFFMFLSSVIPHCDPDGIYKML